MGMKIVPIDHTIITMLYFLNIDLSGCEIILLPKKGRLFIKINSKDDR
jgi:hypothetical protein